MPQVPYLDGLGALRPPAIAARSPPLCWPADLRPSLDIRGCHVHAPRHRQGSQELMLTILFLAVGTVMALVLVLLALMVIGMKREPLTEELSMQAPSLFAALVRRLLGVYVRKPDSSLDERRGKPCLTARDPGRRWKPLRAYTVEQVAEMLHVGRDKVYYLIRTGQLRSLKIGKLRRITEQQLADFIASLNDAAWTLPPSQGRLGTS
jgi:excisionase family DNA binding protein